MFCIIWIRRIRVREICWNEMTSCHSVERADAIRTLRGLDSEKKFAASSSKATSRGKRDSRNHIVVEHGGAIELQVLRGKMTSSGRDSKKIVRPTGRRSTRQIPAYTNSWSS